MASPTDRAALRVATASPTVGAPDSAPRPDAPTGALPRGRIRILVAADLGALSVAMALTYTVADAMAPPSIMAAPAVAAPLLVAGWLGWVAIFTAYKLYEREGRSIATASFDEVANLFHALLAGNLAYLLAAQ